MDSLRTARNQRAWAAQEAERLLEAVDSRRPVRVYLANNPEAIYTTVLGFDLNKAELLLDTFQPGSLYELMVFAEHKKALTLALTLAGGTWFLHCTFSQVDTGNRHYVISVKVISSQLSASKRLHQRIFFNTACSPGVMIDPSWSPPLKGELLDLSAYGCQIRIFGQDLRQQFNSRATRIKLNFNDDFQLSCRGEVKQLQFLRLPCCHNKLRVLFKQLDPLQQEQLNTFVHSMNLDSVA